MTNQKEYLGKSNIFNQQADPLKVLIASLVISLTSPQLFANNTTTPQDCSKIEDFSKKLDCELEEEDKKSEKLDKKLAEAKDEGSKLDDTIIVVKANAKKAVDTLKYTTNIGNSISDGLETMNNGLKQLGDAVKWTVQIITK